MSDDFSEIKVSRRFYQEAKKAAEDEVLAESEKQNLQQLAAETSSSGDDSLLAYLQDSGNVKAFRQAAARGSIPASVDIFGPGQVRLRVTVTAVPPEVMDRAERLWTAYNRQSQRALDAIYADGYADFIDTFGGTGRIRPDDAADAVLRLNTSLWTVLRDIRGGAIGPEAFGKRNWSHVDARAMYDLAISRLNKDAIDYDDVIPAMQSDPIWRSQPIMVPDPHQEKPVELKPGNFSGFWKRSLYSVLAPNEATESFEALPFARDIRDGAISVAAGTGSEAAATVDTAYAFFAGRGIAANASQALAAVTQAAGINILAEVTPAPAGTTKEQLQRQVEKSPGKDRIDGFIPLPGGQGFLTYRLKSIPQIASEAKTLMDSGQLNHLPPGSRHKLQEMIGPSGNPGATLQGRIEKEDSGRWWRQFSSEVVQLAAIGLASGGVGAIAEGGALALGAGRFAVGAARLVASSASFTTLMGMAQGELDWQRYPIDLAMFGVLGAAGRFTKLAGKLIPGSRFGQLVVGHAATVVGADAVLTGFNTLEETARTGKVPGLDALTRQFGRNLAMVSVLHGINLGLAGMGLQPGSPLLREQQKLVDRTLQADAKVQNTLTRLAEVTEALDKQSHLPVDAPERTRLAEQAAALMKEFEAQAKEIDALRTDLLKFAEHNLPRGRVDELRKNLGEAGKGPPSKTELLEELKAAGIKHTPENMVDIRRAGDGRIVFLEKGNSKAGLQHILEQHAADFARRGIPQDQIPELVMMAVTEGKVVGSQGKAPGRPIYEVTFNGQTHYVAVSVGSNGFIVGANPASMK